MNQESVRQSFGLHTSILKLIAMICMIVDHVAVIFFPRVLELRIIGRIAFPLYAWCLCVGADMTHDMTRYLGRIFILFFISQPFYMMALHHKMLELNIFATLALGLLGIIGIQQKKYGSHIWAPVLCVLLSCFIKVDYGFKGVLFIILLYLAKDNKPSLCAMMIAFCLYWGHGTQMLYSFCGISTAPIIKATKYGSQLFTSLLCVQTSAILSLPLILMPCQSRLRLPKWLSYAVYPAHLCILWLLRLLLNI